MLRMIWILAVCLSVAGCANETHVHLRKTQGHPVAKTKKPLSGVIASGMKIDQVEAVLQANGAKDISMVIGYLPLSAERKDKYYRLESVVIHVGWHKETRKLVVLSFTDEIDRLENKTETWTSCDRIDLTVFNKPSDAKENDVSGKRPLPGRGEDASKAGK